MLKNGSTRKLKLFSVLGLKSGRGRAADFLVAATLLLPPDDVGFGYS